MVATAGQFRTKLPRTNRPSGRTLWEQARKGLAPILQELSNFLETVQNDVVPEALEDAVQPTLELSNHYAPKDTHTMVNSSYVQVKRSARGIGVEVGYNKNGEAPYTIFVHEMPQFYHDPPTQYKFLERAMDEDAKNIIGRIIERLKV